MPTEPLVTRLNVLALPTRTTLLFLLIVLVVASPVVASLGGGSTICTPFLVVGVFILPIRALLRRPAQELEKCKKVDISECYPLLVERWNHLAVNNAHTQPPRLVPTIRDPVEPYSFGTFTRRYVALSDSVTQEIQIKLQSADESVRKSSEAGGARLARSACLEWNGARHCWADRREHIIPDLGSRLSGSLSALRLACQGRLLVGENLLRLRKIVSSAIVRECFIAIPKTIECVILRLLGNAG